MMETLNDHYGALRLTPEATTADITAAWKRLRRTLHPDMGGNVDDFAALSAAYHVLSHPQRRFDYDATLPDSSLPPQKENVRTVGQTDRLVQDYLTQRSRRAENLKPVLPERTLSERPSRRGLFRR